MDLIAAYLRACRIALRPTTLRVREWLLRRCDDALWAAGRGGLLHASPDDLIELLGQPGWSEWTRATYYMHLRAYYRWLSRRGYADPLESVPRPRSGDRLPRPLRDDQVAQALRMATHQPWALIIRLAAYAGMRAAEIAAAWREDITPELITIRQAKGGRMQTVPTHPEIWSYVQHLSPGPLMVTRSGRIMTANYLSGITARWLRRHGIPGTLHQLRHWYATRLLMQTGDLRLVQELMRHASIQSTVGYTAIVPSRRAAAVQMLPSISELGALNE